MTWAFSQITRGRLLLRRRLLPMQPDPADQSVSLALESDHLWPQFFDHQIDGVEFALQPHEHRIFDLGRWLLHAIHLGEALFP